MSARRSLWLLLLIPAILVSGCRKGPDEAVGAGIRTETVDGVVLVHNPPVPLNPLKAVRFEEELSFGAEEEGPGAVYQPGQFAVDGRDQVYIFESSESTIKVFDKDGRFLRGIGRKGQGPGEFSQTGFPEFCPDGRLLVTDYQNRRTSFFGPEGDFLTSYQWMRTVSIPLLILDNTFIAQESVFDAGTSRLFLKTYDLEGAELKSWGEFTNPAVKRITRGNTVAGFSIPHSPRSVLAGDPALRRIYHCLNNAYLIDVYDHEGCVFRKIDRPYERLPFTDADRKEFISRMSVPKKLAELLEDVFWPEIKSVTERMVCDDRGYLWVATHETKDEGGSKLTAYDVFDTEGRYDARVWLGMTPQRFAAGKMYRFKEDADTGQRVLTRYRVVWE
jgi:hypothetical protein